LCDWEKLVRDAGFEPVLPTLNIPVRRGPPAHFQNALRKCGVTGETLLQLLETRLDNVVYRLGLANPRSAARQLAGL